VHRPVGVARIPLRLSPGCRGIWWCNRQSIGRSHTVSTASAGHASLHWHGGPRSYTSIGRSRGRRRTQEMSLPGCMPVSVRVRGVHVFLVILQVEALKSTHCPPSICSMRNTSPALRSSALAGPARAPRSSRAAGASCFFSGAVAAAGARRIAIRIAPPVTRATRAHQGDPVRAAAPYADLLVQQLELLPGLRRSTRLPAQPPSDRSRPRPGKFMPSRAIVIAGRLRESRLPVVPLTRSGENRACRLHLRRRHRRHAARASSRRHRNGGGGGGGRVFWTMVLVEATPHMFGSFNPFFQFSASPLIDRACT